MDLDNCVDIELLRNLCKRHMVKVRKDFLYKDFLDEERQCLFKKDHWYDVDQDEFGVNVYGGDCIWCLSYEYAKEYLYIERTTYNI